MLPKFSLIIYICINTFDYNAIIVYFTVLKPGTLYLAWYRPYTSTLVLPTEYTELDGFQV